MVAHIARTARPARRLVEHRRHLHRRRAGRARRLLRPVGRRPGAGPQARSQLAVTETARGGILLKGIGLTRNDVSVFTNVSADHLGLQGIDTLDQLAEVKGVVPRITRPDGWAVLNGDDPRVYATRTAIKAKPWVFSRDPDSPAIRETLSRRRPGHHRHRRLALGADPRRRPRPAGRARRRPDDAGRAVPLQRRERARRRVGRAGASGCPARRSSRGCASFRPDPEHNPGRMNFFSRDDVSVVIDLAHNEAGLEALLEIMNGVRRPGARLLLGLGAVGRPAGRPGRPPRRDGRPRRRRGGDRAQGEVPARPHHRGARRAVPGRCRAGRRRPTSPSYPHGGGRPRRAGRPGRARRRGRR